MVTGLIDGFICETLFEVSFISGVYRGLTSYILLVLNFDTNIFSYFAE